MKFLNVGALELLFILLLAFIVLGPEKAIKTAGDIARWIRDLTKSEFWRDLVTTSKEIRNIPTKLMDDLELQKTIEDLEMSDGETRGTINKSNKTTDQSSTTPENEDLANDQKTFNSTKES
jgi:Sec-independent protein translocase protein TatA